MATRSEPVGEPAPAGSAEPPEVAAEVPVHVTVDSAISDGFLARLARGAIFAFAIQVLGAGLAYLMQISFARWMGVVQFGVYTYVVAWVTTLAMLVGLGF